MTGYFLPMFRRPLGGEFRWCPQWWAHPEAVSRLTALWRSWEAFRLEPSYRDLRLVRRPPRSPPADPARRPGPVLPVRPGSGHLDADPFPADEIDYDVRTSARRGDGDTPGAGR